MDDGRAVGRSGVRPLIWLAVALAGLGLAGSTVLLFGTSSEAFVAGGAVLAFAVLLLFLLDFR